MRLAKQRNNIDCAPVAIYNVARAIDAPFARGGYQSCLPKLAELCYDPQRNGTTYKRVLPALRHALLGTPYTADLVYRKQGRWGWIIKRLLDDPLSLGIVAIKITPYIWHTAMIWMPPGDFSIWAANWKSVEDRTRVALWFRGDKPWWPTVYVGNERPRVFWQVRKRR